MINKIKENKNIIERILLISAIVLISFYIIYKLSNSLFMVITGSIILLIGSFVKDPEIKESKKAYTKLEQLTIFSEEVLEPSIIRASNNKKSEVVTIKTKKEKKSTNKQVLDIENTNSYKLDELNKKIKKTKKVKA